MSTSTTSLALDQWQIVFHETMAALLRAQQAINRQFGLVGLLNGLWKASRDLKALNASLKAMSELPDGVHTENLIQSQIPQLRKLLCSMEELIDAAKRMQLRNRSLTAAPLGLIIGRGEYIADFLDTLEMSIDPEVLKAINEGREQIARGDCKSVGTLY